MAKRVLITGENGFIGSNLLSQFLEFEPIPSGFDILNYESVFEKIDSIKPDVILHLAGLSLPAQCDQNPSRAYQVNLGGTAIILEAMLKTRSRARLVFASTAQVYQPLKKGREIPITEAHPLEPINFYARTKRAAEIVIQEYCEKYAIKGLVLRIFNHVHHTQKMGTFLSSIYQDILKQKGASPELVVPVGNMELYRDMGSVKDFLTALQAVIRCENAIAPFDVLNICNGMERKLSDLAEELVRQMGVQVRFEVDSLRLRENDPFLVQGSHERLTQLTGWTPATRTNEELVRAFLN